MNQTQLSPLIWKYGLTGGLVSSLVFLIFTITGLAKPGSNMAGMALGFLNLAVLIALVVVAVRKHRDEMQEGFISLGQCMLLGMGIIMLSALIAGLVSLIYTQFIDPGYMDRIMAGMEEAWEAQGLDEDQIEKAKEMTSIMKSPMLSMAANLACYGIGGAIISLIVGLIMKNEKPEFS